MSDRIEWIDRWKGLLIIFVVVGHIVGGAYHFVPDGDRVIYQYVFKTIYVFHMPAFFFLAGVMWRDNQALGVFLVKKARRLLIPYVVFGLFSIAVYFAFINHAQSISESANDMYYANLGLKNWWMALAALAHAGGWPCNEGFRCNSVLWFLPAMFSVSCVFWVIRRFCRTALQHFVICAIMLIVYAFHRYLEQIPLPWGMRVLPWYLVMMVAGYYSNLLRIIENKWAKRILPLLIVIYLWALWFTPPLDRFDWSYIWYICFIPFTFTGIIMSAILARYVRMRTLSVIGASSLGIMLLHKFILVVIQFRLPAVKKFIACGGYLSALVCVSIAVITILVSYYCAMIVKVVLPSALGEQKGGC